MNTSPREKLHTACGFLQRGIKTFRKKGFAGVAAKVRGRIRRRKERARFDSYEDWIRANEPDEAELRRQRAECAKFDTGVDIQSDASMAGAAANTPLFSILVPVYRTRPLFLSQLVDSVLAQTYPNWELVLADGSAFSAGDAEASSWEQLISSQAGRDPRIRRIPLQENGGIAGNTNAAYAAAKGDWIGFLDHDDTISADALYRMAKALQKDGDIDIFYSDVDNLSEDGTHRLLPHFKADYNLQMLCSMNYLCHFLVVKKSLLQQVLTEENSLQTALSDTGNGTEATEKKTTVEMETVPALLRSGFEGAQDYDLVLRCCERTDRVCHIPRVLYHWRAYGESTAENPESKLYAFEAGKRAVQAHYDRLHLPGTAENTAVYGTYQTRWHSKKEPLVSVLIPNRDQPEILDRCLQSLLSDGGYENIEVLLLENGSTEAATVSCYEKWQAKDARVQVFTWRGEMGCMSGSALADAAGQGTSSGGANASSGSAPSFNYSAINNFGASHARGEYLLLLNNDTSIRTPGAIRTLVETAICEGAGVVGARLFYPDDSIQHAGIYLGLGGVAGHAFAGADENDPGYFNRIIAMQQLSAVTGACLLVEKALYEQAGGMDERLAVTFNDVDLCLRVRRLGSSVIYNPDATLYHYESKSRGSEDSEGKRRRFGKEIELFSETWEDVLSAGDPFYNPNLSLDDAGFGLAQRSRVET